MTTQAEIKIKLLLTLVLILAILISLGRLDALLTVSGQTHSQLPETVRQLDEIYSILLRHTSESCKQQVRELVEPKYLELRETLLTLAPESHLGQDIPSLTNEAQGSNTWEEK